MEQFREGIVYYWPKTQQKEGKPPLRGRLMRIHSVRHKTDVWLFTNVEDPQQLSWETAATCYRWRWENEGFFRTYKRTLKKATLMGRTVAQVHREAEASMIATQLLLCQGAMAMPPGGEERTSGDVQPATRVAGSASRHLRTQGTHEALCRRIARAATRTARTHQREGKTRMAAPQATYGTPSAPFAEADGRTKDHSSINTYKRHD